MGVVWLISPYPLTALPLSCYVVFAFLSGIAVGGIGVGGVGLTPGLLILGVSSKVAIKIVLASFFIPGFIASWMWKKHLSKTRTLFLSLCIAPSACGAAYFLTNAPKDAFPPLIGSLALFSSFERRNRSK